MKLLARAALFSFVGLGVAPVPQSFLEYGGGIVVQNRQAVFSELSLTPANVSAATFGKIATVNLDGAQIYASPLFVQGVTVGAGTYDLLIVATMNNSIWAVDANAFAPVWKTALGGGLFASYPKIASAQNNFYTGTPVGCIATPTVDRAQGLIFAVCPNAAGNWTLYELSLSTGTVLNSVVISGQYPGMGTTGDTIISGQLQFLPTQHMARPGLVLSGGQIYVSFASFNDVEPYHGWVFAYAESNLSQTAVYCATPNGPGGGIWLTGDAPAVDSAGNLYVSTGNGLYDGTGSNDYGDSVLKLSPSLTLLDWFTAANYADLQANDLDVTSGRIMLTGDGYLLAGDKDYREYLLSTSCMGHLQGSGCAPQLVTVPGSGSFGIYGGLFFRNVAYVPVTSGKVYSYAYTTGALANSATASTSSSFAHPGARLALSVNGYTNAVLWATTCASSSLYSAVAGVLRAFDPVTLAELYNSTTNGGDALGTFGKFNLPVVSNGHVIVANGDGKLVFYGLK